MDPISAPTSLPRMQQGRRLFGSGTSAICLESTPAKNALSSSASFAGCLLVSHFSEHPAKSTASASTLMSFPTRREPLLEEIAKPTMDSLWRDWMVDALGGYLGNRNC